jgi:hypothetical protein
MCVERAFGLRLMIHSLKQNCSAGVFRIALSELSRITFGSSSFSLVGKIWTGHTPKLTRF